MSEHTGKPPPNHQPGAILCVDDESVVTDALRSLLAKNFRGENIIEVAQSAAEALEIIEELQEEGIEVQVVISDYIMPEIKGDELLIRAHKIIPRSKKIMLTGQSDIRGIKRAINEAELYRFLEKPWNNEDLSLTIKGAMTAYNHEKELERQNTELKRLNEALEAKVAERTRELTEKNNKLQQYFKTLDKYVITTETDARGKIIYASEAFRKISGYSPEELIGADHNIIRHPDMPDDVFKNLWETVKSGQAWIGELKNLSKDGKHFWVTASIEPVHNAKGKIVGYRAIRQDITDKKRAEKLAITDRLTGLYNRLMLDQALNKETQQAKRYGTPLAILLLDLDKFKSINDTHGHQAGDQVLRNVGNILKTQVRHSDIAGRWGGEEFLLILPNTDLIQAQTVAEKLRAMVEAFDFPIIGTATASFGISAFHQNDSKESLVERADQALYRAKELGRNRVALEEK